MNKTLQNYLDEADKFHNIIMNGNIMIDPSEIKSMLNKISKNIKTIQAVSHRMASIYTMSKRKISTLSKLIEKEISKEKSETLPGHDDWRKVQNPTLLRQVAPCVNVKAITVSDINEIPNAHLYWVKNIGQFAININGTLLRGNIGNIYNKTDAFKKNVRECRDYKKCLSRVKPCNNFHDPLKFNRPMPCRNFTNSSWLYTNDTRAAKNINMRHFGNRNTLSNDLSVIKYSKTYDREINTRLSQTIHDLLVLMSMQSKDMINN